MGPEIPTTVNCYPAASGARTKVVIETKDRPGLLVDIVSTLKDLSLNVVSADVETIGFVAKDILFVTYRGVALNKPMVSLVENSLRYYLTLAEIEKDESY